MFIIVDNIISSLFVDVKVIKHCGLSGKPIQRDKIEKNYMSKNALILK